MKQAHEAQPMKAGEFIPLMALLMSLVALSIDAILPALPLIGEDLGLANSNDAQLMVGVLFLGLAIGQIFFGPMSDSYGRKPAIYLGLVIFLAGSVISALATDYTLMLVGRFLQGIGASGPRTISIALIRDQYEGRAMARIMSFIMAVFILVPTIAPALGQMILQLAQWHSIFYSFCLLGTIALIWFALRQPETLSLENRSPFSRTHIWGSIKIILANRQSRSYMIAAGVVFGAFVGYLNSAQQIFQDIYFITDLFPLYFAVLALSIGIASFVNAKLVIKHGMRKLSQTALVAMTILALGFSLMVALTNSAPPLWGFMAYMITSFFCIGLLFSNFNALAMEPLGKIAGIASAVIGSVTTFICMAIGVTIGQIYNGTVLPLVSSFAILGLISLLIVFWVERKSTTAIGSQPTSR
ncbi:multidrug effflux MFS transporter [Kiloniella laminariae]|uniref:Bcr/CflA family efflux transporter n=1 Tax=Kiloniella laminariae TaxID=454162 RepID=A0ABT4LMD1_9PROT|nr:multidrug effflux MFS transporter [Kiloniella laminariae]MCZ4282290.1 multidrug effflux MFS transporter [Kiloniella laminariae]